MDHSHMDHSHMDHSHMDHGPKCNMNVGFHLPSSMSTATN